MVKKCTCTTLKGTKCKNIVGEKSVDKRFCHLHQQCEKIFLSSRAKKKPSPKKLPPKIKTPSPPKIKTPSPLSIEPIFRLPSKTPRASITPPKHALKRPINSSECENIGGRKNMEDAHILQTVGNWNIYGVFDGHGADYVSKWLRNNIEDEVKYLLFANNVKKIKNTNKFSNDFANIILNMDENIFKNTDNFESRYKVSKWYGGRLMDAGSTLTLALYSRISKYLFVANVGDSEACIFTESGIIDCAKTHKPDDPDELKRIKAAGHFVAHYQGAYRVDGNLSLSRAIGDFKFKVDKDDDKIYLGEEAAITAYPDVLFADLSKQKSDVYIYLCSDGITNALNEKALKDFDSNIVLTNNIIELIKKGMPLQQICDTIIENLLKSASNPQYLDNMTLLLAKLV